LEYELVRDEDDLPQQHCLEAMDPPEANSQPTPNDRQIRSSLVERVARRPKSLKEQALAALTQYLTGKTILTKDSIKIIRRALEPLDD
jgi:hypothetical protein